jgi:hypothetical protein
MTERVEAEHRGSLGATGKYLSHLRRFGFLRFGSQRSAFDCVQGRRAGLRSVAPPAL